MAGRDHHHKERIKRYNRNDQAEQIRQGTEQVPSEQDAGYGIACIRCHHLLPLLLPGDVHGNRTENHDDHKDNIGTGSAVAKLRTDKRRIIHVLNHGCGGISGHTGEYQLGLIEHLKSTDDGGNHHINQNRTHQGHCHFQGRLPGIRTIDLCRLQYLVRDGVDAGCEVDDVEAKILPADGNGNDHTGQHTNQCIGAQGI